MNSLICQSSQSTISQSNTSSGTLTDIVLNGRYGRRFDMTSRVVTRTLANGNMNYLAVICIDDYVDTNTFDWIMILNLRYSNSNYVNLADVFCVNPRKVFDAGISYFGGIPGILQDYDRYFTYYLQCLDNDVFSSINGKVAIRSRIASATGIEYTLSATVIVF